MTRATASTLISAIGLALLLASTGGASAADPVDAGSRWLWNPPASIPLPGRPAQNADSDAATYSRCLSLAKTDPNGARDLAENWQKRGGAHPAEHCLAVSLVALKQYKEGATQLEKLQQEMVHAPGTLRAEVLGQAAQAWLLAGDPARAYTADSSALAIRPDDPDLLVDRAEAAGAAGWYDKAVADLTIVLKANPLRFDALIFRASANRALDKLDPALTDINKALSASPDSASALLERGYIYAFRGDATNAIKDWQRVMAVAPNTGDAATAKANLSRLSNASAAGADDAKAGAGNKAKK